MASPQQLTDEKRRLIEDSEQYRKAIGAEVQNIKASTAWVPRTVGIVRATSPLIALAAPVIGLILGRKKKRKLTEHDEHSLEHKNGKSQKGMVGKALLLFEILRKARPFWEHFQRARERRAESPRPRPRASVREK
jgi:hypothetical protein